VVALKPLHDKAKITRVVVATYQSVSGAGKEAMDELFTQTKSVYTLDEITPKKFPKRMAFNVIPHIDVFMEDGFTKEEWKMVAETKKILDPKIKVVATCVRGRRLRDALRGGGRRRNLCQPHSRGSDGGERPRVVVRV
jgi:aspartate-semialdehyde dehydrogenase